MNLPTLATARGQLDRLAPWLAPLGLRLLLAWEYFESGREKLQGQNWFADLQDAFPFPFNQLPAALNWQLATGATSGDLAAVVGEDYAKPRYGRLGQSPLLEALRAGELREVSIDVFASLTKSAQP